MKDETFLKLGLSAIAVSAIMWCIIFQGCSMINQRLGLQDDNPVEEAIEEIIENKTGAKIDVTPEPWWNLFETDY